jgi:probable rRNA maturation factor
MNKLTIDCDNEYDFSKLAAALYKELKQTAALSAEIIFIDESGIQKLNKETRDIDKVTDVLSYPSLDGIKGLKLYKKNYPLDLDEDGNIFLGSIAICKEVALSQAQEFNHSIEREIYYLALHGLLHLFGYDHLVDADKIEMREIEEKIMNKINLNREI